MIDHVIWKVSSYEKWNIQWNIAQKYQYWFFCLTIISILFTRGIWFFDEWINSNNLFTKTTYVMRNTLDLYKIGISYALAIVKIPWGLSYLHKYSENKMLYNASSLVELCAHILFQASSIISIVAQKQYVKVPHKT